MSKLCPNCGSASPPEARYCRRCGASLRAAAGDDETVSPRAATVPLRDEARATDGLAGDGEAARPAPDTSRVNRAEMEAILRSATKGETGGVVPPPPAAPHATPTLHDHAAQEASDGDGHGADTNPNLGQETAEELTITVPRPSQPFAETSPPARVEPSPTVAGATQDPAPPAASSTSAHAAPPAPPDSRPGPAGAGAGRDARATPTHERRLWAVFGVACVGGILIAVTVVLLVMNFRRAPAPGATNEAAPPAQPAALDPAQAFNEKVAEAEALLAAGDREGALQRLREANRLDPSNARAHRRLGELLLETGARREAIEEFRALAANNPEDFTAWRLLASAQFAEGLHADAAVSYRRLFDLVGEGGADATDLLSYADALRLSGRTEEARAAYQRLAASPSAGETATVARQRLAEMQAEAARASASPTPARDARRETEELDELTPAPTPAPMVVAASTPAPLPPPPAPAPTERPVQLSPAERYRRGVELWPSNRAAARAEFESAAAAGNADAHYYLGLGFVEGRNLNTLKRAEIVAALEHFQRAQRGSFSAQSRRYAQQLEREFDRLRNQ